MNPERARLDEMIREALAGRPLYPSSVYWFRLRFYLKWGFPIEYFPN